MSALLDVFGNACAVLFYATFAGAGLFVGVALAARAFPLCVSVSAEVVSRRFGRRKGEDQVDPAPQAVGPKTGGYTG